ncbi:hypothetical protein HK100_000909 [Physocladia obscura]|uniref:HYDIN/VesB/CFA65-like Ig-like domain-containing protein n=1 Tax=Physocladia obscura TaxID=109957 RepID=A0AAD5XGG3_9FUNG|nr:hypothetical protein HK100_000909 [Physocladia obscura]
MNSNKPKTRAVGARKDAVQIKTLSDLVKSLIKRQQAPKTKGSRLWEKLREHVLSGISELPLFVKKRGIFASLLTESEAQSSSFLDNIETLWTLVHRHSSEILQRRNASGSNNSVDSTTEFVAAGWATIKEAKFRAARTKQTNISNDASSEFAKKQIKTADVSIKNDAEDSKDSDEINILAPIEDLDAMAMDDLLPRKSTAVGKSRRQSMFHAMTPASTMHTSNGLGIEGLTFDTVPNINVTSELRIIADGLYSQPLVEADYYTVQVNFNRGWKLMLLGLTQAESFSRYMAMCALKVAIPVINDTLLDYSTVQVCLINWYEGIKKISTELAISTYERKENRLKAIYLLGIIAYQLGFVREHDSMLLKVFRELVKKLMDIQFKERKLSTDEKLKFQMENRALKVYLIHAIGKFTCNPSQNSRYMEDLTVFALHHEFENGDTKVSLKSDGDLKKDSPTAPLFVIKSILNVLVHDVKPTEQNEKYLGAIFKSYVSPLLKVSTQGIQMVAVQFVGNWLPVTNEDNGILAIDALQSGLKHLKELGVENFDKEVYEKEMSHFKKKMVAEESKIALRTKLMKQLLMVPGTYSRLTPVPDHPGFFANNNTSMFNTKAIAVGLPIHPKSNILISRPIPSVPGVPVSATTIPPVFMEQTWFEKLPIPQCYFEAMERAGCTPGLPMGYSYCPTRPIDVYAMKGLEKPKKGTISRGAQHQLSITAPARRKSSFAGFRRPSFAPPNLRKMSEESEVSTPEDSVLPTGFGFVKRRGTILRLDIEKSSPNLEYPIPTGTTRTPPKEDGQRGDARDNKSDHSRNKKPPAGFLSICPFNGFDPDAADRNGQNPSAIYFKNDLDDDEANSILPFGFTFNKNPILWPHKNLSLKTITNTTDFTIYSPVLFDIIQPGSSYLQQILCQVVGIDKDISAVSVRHKANSNLLSAGANFNLFIRNRTNLSRWSCINLQVVDEDYRQAINYTAQKQRNSLQRSNKSLTSLYAAVQNSDGDNRQTAAVFNPGTPVAAGFTSNEDPYFAPPITIPSLPAAYTSDMIPYYGKLPLLKPQPAGMTTDGIRFYHTDGSIPEGSRNLIGGYDNSGQPFYIPKGCLLPAPSGFTSDGISFFDVPTILNQKGVMLLPVPEKNRQNWPIFDEEDDSIAQMELGPDGKSVAKQIDSKQLLHDLLMNLKATQAEINKTLKADRTHITGTIRRLKDVNREVGQTSNFDDDEEILEPDDVMKFLKEGESFAYLKPTNIKVQLDPMLVEFQSMHAPVNKNIVMRYRTNRGDREERDFFISVEPVDVFTVPIFHVKLQGEGMSSILVTFNPIAVHSERITGSLSLIDESGKELVSCVLVGVRQSFIKITPSSIDAGWMLPEKRKEVALKIENLSSTSVFLTLELSSEANARVAVATAAAMLRKNDANAEVNERTVEEMKKKGFVLSQRELKLQPSECKYIAVFFEPYNLGRFVDGIEVSAPGGDLTRVSLNGVSGIPIALYPENAENSLAGGNALSPERVEFMKKFSKGASKEKVHTPLSDLDVSILQNMMSATADKNTRREAHTVDFGICNPHSEPNSMRCVTIMNLSDAPISIGLYPHLSALKCNYLVNIPQRSAITVEIVLNIRECTKGNIKSAIEVICPDFQNIPLYVKGFVGQPLYFNTWDIAYFRPCAVGVTDQMSLTIVNESQYDIEFVIDGLDSTDRNARGLSFFTSQFSDDENQMSTILALNAYPVVFSFTARQRGPYLKQIGFKLSEKFGKIFIPACPSGNRLVLIGICFEPWFHSPGTSPDKNSLELMRLWMSHPKRVLDEYQQYHTERNKRFELIEFNEIYKQRSNPEEFDVILTKESVTFRQPNRSAYDDPMSNRRTQIQSLMAKNQSNLNVPIILIASTQFNIEPQSKILKFGTSEVADIMFVPPLDLLESVTLVGFAAVISDDDHRLHAIQVYSKPAVDFLIFPSCGRDGMILLDFGRVETSTNGFDVNTKWLLMINNFSQCYSWNLKFVNAKSKFNPFETGVSFGELDPRESFPIRFNFRSDASGIFESIVEISIKDATDRSAKPIRLPTIVLRAHSVITAMSGFPESIDFGSSVAFQTKTVTFALNNNGVIEAKVLLYCKAPFAVEPKSFELPPKGIQDITVSFMPTESRTSVGRVQIFANQRLYMIPASGSGGTADLICEMYGSKDVDFGTQKEGTIAWVSIYLTNKGTLPLSLNAATATRPELIKLEYCGITSTIPYSGNQSNKNPVSVRKNYWAILRRKFSVYVALKGMSKGNIFGLHHNSVSKRKDSFVQQLGVIVSVLRLTPSFNAHGQTLIPLVPELRPFYSYHFRVGYLCKYQPVKDTSLHFHYKPITTGNDESDQSTIREMSIGLTGKVYRPLEFLPSSFDFGITAVEFIEDSWKKLANGAEEQPSKAVTNLSVLNMSFEAQNLTLDFLTPEFKISGKTWSVSAGEKILIPIEFRPPKQQTQYRGEARFIHNGEKKAISLTGTGASAELVADDSVDFGSVKLGSVSQHNLRLCNRGLLDCRFMMDITQKGNHFRFTDDEPYEYEGVIISGCAELIELECCCDFVISSKATISLKWEKVPGGVWESISIPLLVQIGLPVFKLGSLELDFKTTYINVNKTLEFVVTNDGNAACYWAIESSSPLLKIVPENGTIMAGTTMALEVTFVPENFDNLSAEIAFFTDAGRKTVMCYGLVGIPYLMIPRNFLDINFGISAVDKAQTRTISMSNTGPKPIIFEIIIQNTLEDGVTTDSEFEVFFVNPANGTLAPGMSQTVLIQAIPKRYGSAISANFIVNTRDGERYVGIVTVTGGKAIIKIAPPTVLREDGGDEVKTAEFSPADIENMEEIKQTALFEMTRIALHSHLENLKDVLSGLRTEDLENLETGSREIQGKKSVAGKQKGKLPPKAPILSRSMTPTQPNGAPAAISPRKKKDLQMLQKAEAVIQEKLSREEIRRKSTSSAIYDGSDLRSKVKKALELAHSGGYKRKNSPDKHELDNSKKFEIPKIDTVSESEQTQSEKFLQEMATLESELEVLTTVLKTVNSASQELSFSTPSSSNSSVLLRYHAGSPKKLSQGKTSSVLQTPKSRTSGFTQTPKSRGHNDNNFRKFSTSPNTNLPENKLSEREESVINAETSIIDSDTGFIGTQTSSESLSQKHSTGSLNSSSLPTRSSNSNMQSSTFSTPSYSQDAISRSISGKHEDFKESDPLENLIRLAHHYSTLLNSEKTPDIQQKLIEQINAQIVSSTKGVVKLVKAQLSSSWVPNREFLSTALYQVQQSGIVIEALKVSDPSKNITTENDFNLGLIRSGDKLSNVNLFNLPNMGNIALNFTIKQTLQMKLRPSEFPENDENELFKINPIEGSLEPGNSINFSVSFLTRVAGFYQQGFILESGGETVLSFSITAMSGIPLIQVAPKIVDFGLVSKNKFDIRSIVISNVGTFRDNWRLDAIKSRGAVADDDEELFFPNCCDGVLEARKSVTVDVKFTPKTLGNFTKLYRIIWAGEPCTVEVKGIGGSARLKYELRDVQDLKFGGFDWGVTIVGLNYTKSFTVKNIGNVEGYFHLSHPNSLFRFNLNLDSNGECRIDPGLVMNVVISFDPLYSEKIVEPIQIHLAENPMQQIPLNLVSGTLMWVTIGDANLKNMSIKDVQLISISVINTGTLKLPFDCYLELQDPEMKGFIKTAIPQLDAIKFENGMTLAPGQEISVDIIVTPKKEHRRIRGQLILMAELGNGPNFVKLPFDFWTYDKQLSLDDSKDVSVGRVLVGETASVSRTLTNFGSDRVKYRIRIETIPETGSVDFLNESEMPELKGGKKKPAQKIKRKTSIIKETSWKLKDIAEGYLEPNDCLDLQLTFESLNEHGDEWQNARMIIEKCDNEPSNIWSELSSMKLTGAAGTPKLALSIENIDFGVTGKGILKAAVVTFGNEGNALLSFEIESGWDYDSEIFLENSKMASGKIFPGESFDVIVKFKPMDVQEYISSLVIKTQTETKNLVITGTGALYKFWKDSLPSVVSFGEVMLGEKASQKITVFNDCVYDIEVQPKIFETDPFLNPNQNELNRYLFLEPKLLEISGNSTQTPKDLSSRSYREFEVILKSPLFEAGEKSSLGDIDAEKLIALCTKKENLNYLQLVTLGGDAETGNQRIPVTYKFSMFEMVALSPAKCNVIKKGDAVFEEEDRISIVDFGEVGYEFGGSLTLAVYNRNAFRLVLSAKLADGSKYTVFPVYTTIAPRNSKEFRLELKAVNVAEAGEVESTLNCQDTITFTSQVSYLSNLDIKLNGTYIDEPDRMDFSQPINFGPVRRLFQGSAAIEFRNPVRRALKYKVTIEKDYCDIFFFEREKDIFSGIAKPRANISIPVLFQPKLGTDYLASCLLETDERNFSIILIGQGVNPSIMLSTEDVNFGIIGVGAAEFQIVKITNNSKVEITFKVNISKSIFTIDKSSEDEIKLEPGREHNLKIICSPTEHGIYYKETIEIINLDIPPAQKKVAPFAFLKVEAIGGTCAFNFTPIEENEDPDENEEGIQKTPSIFVNFTKIIQGQRVRKYFEVENCGDTMIDLAISDVDGHEAKDDLEMFSEKTSFTFSPTTILIKPHMKQKFSVIAKGLKVGEDIHFVHIRTRTHMEARIIPIKIKTKILSPESQLGESLKVFSRADNSIDVVLMTKTPDESASNPDLELWKIFIPVVRVSLEMPSEELKCIACVEPNTNLPDISSFVIRPPALPKEIAQRVKKWYAGRTSMALDEANKLTPKTSQRRQEALEWVRPVEKQVWLEKKPGVSRPERRI